MRDIRLKQGTYTLGEAINKMLEKYQLVNAVDLTVLRDHWAEIAGTTIAKYTTDLYLKNQTLYIRVGHSALKQELSYLKSDLIASINTFFKKKLVVDMVIN